MSELKTTCLPVYGEDHEKLKYIKEKYGLKSKTVALHKVLSRVKTHQKD